MTMTLEKSSGKSQKAIQPKLTREEAEKIFSGTGGSENAVNQSVIETLLEKRYQKDIDHLLELRKKKDTMTLKERQSALNATNAVTGVMAVWALIGIVMLGKSCINIDPGPKFKV